MRNSYRRASQIDAPLKSERSWLRCPCAPRSASGTQALLAELLSCRETAAPERSPAPGPLAPLGHALSPYSEMGECFMLRLSSETVASQGLWRGRGLGAGLSGFEIRLHPRRVIHPLHLQVGALLPGLW